ncbi:hypothetical protein GCM10010339_74220 [Streptomyces alanosinicus]|uniref:Uncharacterized protein n=1 Tax=Streptomyces alanosinicus TaxID=68171 RepID=A0A919D6G6_9ACTN|nr:hypothetical protein GCM10010339_74220 [Streptomyces alanosinicus]
MLWPSYDSLDHGGNPEHRPVPSSVSSRSSGTRVEAKYDGGVSQVRADVSDPVGGARYGWTQDSEA